jgi:hypothetical protein
MLTLRPGNASISRAIGDLVVRRGLRLGGVGARRGRPGAQLASTAAGFRSCTRSADGACRTPAPAAVPAAGAMRRRLLAWLGARDLVDLSFTSRRYDGGGTRCRAGGDVADGVERVVETISMASPGRAAASQMRRRPRSGGHSSHGRPSTARYCTSYPPLGSRRADSWLTTFQLATATRSIVQSRRSTARWSMTWADAAGDWCSRRRKMARRAVGRGGAGTGGRTRAANPAPARPAGSRPSRGLPPPRVPARARGLEPAGPLGLLHANRGFAAERSTPRPCARPYRRPPWSPPRSSVPREDGFRSVIRQPETGRRAVA